MIFNMVGAGGSGQSLLISDTLDANGGTIRTITAKVVKLQTKTITPTSSAQIVNPDTGYDGFSQVTVNADSGGSSTDFIVTLNYEEIESGIYGWVPNKTSAELYQAFSNNLNIITVINKNSYTSQQAVAVDAQYMSDYGSLYYYIAADLGSNTYEITEYNYVSDNLEVMSDYTYIRPLFQSKTVSPTTSQQVIQPDSGYNGLEQVTVNAMPTMTLPTSAASSATSGYTNKATISRSTSTQYINIPPGYNSTGAYYTISATPNGSVTAPSSISGTSATITTGTNTLTLTKTVSVTPSVTTAGYISSGTAGNSSVSLTASVTINPTPTVSGATVTIPAGYYSSQTTKSVSSGSASAPSSISGTSATVSTGTNTLTLTKTVSVTPTVSAGYVSSGTATNSSVSLTASVTTKAAATITPTTTNQTIASGTYLTGTQTIAGDADLVASNIVSGVQIFGVTGNVVLQNYYTGSSAPSSSLGSNGDIYLQS